MVHLCRATLLVTFPTDAQPSGWAFLATTSHCLATGRLPTGACSLCAIEPLEMAATRFGTTEIRALLYAFRPLQLWTTLEAVDGALVFYGRLRRAGSVLPWSLFACAPSLLGAGGLRRSGMNKGAGDGTRGFLLLPFCAASRSACPSSSLAEGKAFNRPLVARKFGSLGRGEWLTFPEFGTVVLTAIRQARLGAHSPRRGWHLSCGRT